MVEFDSDDIFIILLNLYAVAEVNYYDCGVLSQSIRELTTIET